MSSILSKLINLAGNITGTLAVANGGTGVTTSTGTTNVVLSNGPTLVAPVLGTPASGNLSNCTSYPAANTSTAGTVSYEDSGTFSATFTGPVSLGPLTCSYVRVGKMVTIIIPASNGTSAAGAGFSASAALPSGIRPSSTTQYGVCGVQNAGSFPAGQIVVLTNGNIGIYANLDSGNFNSSGTVGWGQAPINFTYIIA